LYRAQAVPRPRGLADSAGIAAHMGSLVLSLLMDHRHFCEEVMDTSVPDQFPRGLAEWPAELAESPVVGGARLAFGCWTYAELHRHKENKERHG
jgi:hypothetical protein